MKRIIGLIIIILGFIQCTNSQKNERNTQMIEIDTLDLNKQLLHLVKNYIDEYPQYNNYIIYTNFSGKDEIDRLRMSENLFVIVPANMSIYSGKWFITNHSPSHYFEFIGKKIFLRTEIDVLYKSGFCQKEYKQFADKDTKSHNGWLFSISGTGTLDLISKDAEDFMKIPEVIEDISAIH